MTAFFAVPQARRMDPQRWESSTPAAAARHAYWTHRQAGASAVESRFLVLLGLDRGRVLP